jgi:hypothetical protein
VRRRVDPDDAGYFVSDDKPIRSIAVSAFCSSWTAICSDFAIVAFRIVRRLGEKIDHFLQQRRRGLLDRVADEPAPNCSSLTLRARTRRGTARTARRPAATGR